MLTVVVRMLSFQKLPNKSYFRLGCSYWPSVPLAIVALLPASCASLDPVDYPREWSARPSEVLANGCPDLSGTYSIQPSEVYPSGLGLYPRLNEALSPITLRDFANNQEKPWPELPGATKATFSAQGEWLHVILRDEVEGQVSVRFKRKSWWGGLHENADAMPLCIQLELGPTSLFESGRRPLWAAPFGVGQAAWFGETEFESVALSKDRDGALIVNYRVGSMFITTILIGSYGEWVGNVWWRYPPVESDR